MQLRKKPSEVEKFETSSTELPHSEKLSSINLFQTKGFEGVAISSRFSRSSIKITEKATVVLVPIAMPAMCLYEVSFVELDATNSLQV